MKSSRYIVTVQSGDRSSRFVVDTSDAQTRHHYGIDATERDGRDVAEKIARGVAEDHCDSGTVSVQNSSDPLCRATLARTKAAR